MRVQKRWINIKILRVNLTVSLEKMSKYQESSTWIKIYLKTKVRRNKMLIIVILRKLRMKKRRKVK